MTRRNHTATTSPGRPESAAEEPVLLETRNLCQAFVVRDGWRKRSRLLAARDINLVLRQGEAYGLVGESGSGKSTVARMIMRLLQPTSGTILFEGQEITAADGADLKRLRENIQIVFQDPHASLNPRKTIFFSVAEPLVIHRNLRGAALRNRVAELLDTVRLSTNFLYRYPHELSGGQKQRVCIARAVALNPKLLILDEPTSALDVSVQAQILDFLRDLKARLGLTYLFISHNLSVVRYLCDRMGVMYLGRIVEEGGVTRIFARPQHPYTEALLSAVPLPQAQQPEGRIVLTGDIPSPIEQPTGCAFHPRCPRKIGEVCERQRPALIAPADGARVACHHYVQTAELSS